MWYYAPKTGKILPEAFVKKLNETFGDKTIDVCIMHKTLIRYPEPTVIEILKKTKSRNHAVRRYMEIHDVSKEEAKRMVHQIANDLKRFKGESKNV